MNPRNQRFVTFVANPTLQTIGGRSGTVGVSIPKQALRKYDLVDADDDPHDPDVDVVVDRKREKLVVEMPLYPESDGSVDYEPESERALAND